jgi:hypothetical protein
MNVDRKPRNADCSILRPRLIAQTTLERAAESIAPAVRCRDPLANEPGRIVSHVLLVTALEFGHPVPDLILMKANDPTLHQCVVTTIGAPRVMIIVCSYCAERFPGAASRVQPSSAS